MMTEEIESTVSHSTYTIAGDEHRAYLSCHGEAATNREVMAKIKAVRSRATPFGAVVFEAKLLANKY